MSPTAPVEGRPREARGSGSHHPLLVLTPQSRRQLARTLVQGLAITQAAERRERTRDGLLGGLGHAAAGAAAFAAWHAATGGAAAPFAAFFGLWTAVQAAFTAGLERQGVGLGPRPLALVLDGPRGVLQATGAWLLPRRFTPDRLVLAAGILVAVRRPLSRRLLVRLYGRAFPQREVDQAIDLLIHLGFVAGADPNADTRQPGLLALTTNGFQLLRGLGVPAPVARPRHDPVVASHILPLFEALERRGVRLPAEPEPVLPAAPAVLEPPVLEPPPAELPIVEAPAAEAPVVEPPAPEPVAAVEPPVIELPVLPRELPPVEMTALVEPVETVEPAEPIETEEPDEEPWEPGETDELPPPPRARRSWRRLVRPGLVAAAIALVGLLASLYFADLGPLHHPAEVATRTMLMPGPSRGVALQFNGRGKLLSSYGGGLYLSIPERLDYKTPISFQNFDMAANCGLVSREVRRASLSPQGRFLWCEMGGDRDGDPRERCLVDLETKTVTHDLVAHNATYGLPGVIGWAGDQGLLMSDEAQPYHGGHWWLVDVATHKPEAVTLPSHGRLLPLATEAGMTMLAGWDLRQLGSWDLSLYQLDAQHAYTRVSSVHATMPDALREAEPRLAAISPDRKFLLVTMRPVGPEVPAQGGSLAVIALADGTATVVSTSTPPLPDQPVFWAPELAGGHYRFYFNGGGPEGTVPCTGEFDVPGAV